MIVTICGSMRFFDQMLIVADMLTLTNHIVLMPFVRKTSAEVVEGNPDGGAAVCEELDALHRVKIDMSDLVYIVSDESGYIGDSTCGERDYAQQLGLPVIFARVKDGMMTTTSKEDRCSCKDSDTAWMDCPAHPQACR